MEGRAALWTLIGIFVVFKIVTTALIISLAPVHAPIVIWAFVAMHWPFAVAAIIFGAAPALFWYRLVRVRAKRAKLQAAEWQVDSPRSVPDAWRID
jgi:hypothetical protein